MEAQNSDVCRLCLKSINPCDEILLNKNQHLIKSISIITGLEVVSDSEQCEYLCSQCRSLLEQCVEFRNTCIKNDGVFREMMTLKYVGKVELDQPAVAEFIKLEPVEIFEENTAQHDTADMGELAGDTNEVLENDTLLTDEVVEPGPEPSGKRNSKKKNDGDTKRSKLNRANNKVPCPQCGVVVAFKNLRNHQKIHDPNRRKVRCPHCPKEYVHSNYMKAHINANHTREFQFPCDRCERTYLSYSALKAHHRGAHSSEKGYTCKVCGERFSTSFSRSYHLRKVHSTARPFACKYCDKTFMSKSNSIDHIRTHTGEKPYKCDTCGKTFSKNSSLVIHKKSHQNSVEDAMIQPGN